MGIETLNYLLNIFLNPDLIFLIFMGTLVGVLVGALPGLSSSMAIALLLPFTLYLEPIESIALMSALYCAGTFGGSITAILINAPGAPPAAATPLMDILLLKEVRRVKHLEYPPSPRLQVESSAYSHSCFLLHF